MSDADIQISNLFPVLDEKIRKRTRIKKQRYKQIFSILQEELKDEDMLQTQQLIQVQINCFSLLQREKSAKNHLQGFNLCVLILISFLLLKYKRILRVN